MNKFTGQAARTLEILGGPAEGGDGAVSISVNKLVYKFWLKSVRALIRCCQFIERTGIGSGNQQVTAEGSEDNPRRLGKG